LSTNEVKWALQAQPDRQQMSLSPDCPRIAGLKVVRVFTSLLKFMNMVRAEKHEELTESNSFSVRCLIDTEELKNY
jgi:hypothetical protein